MVTFRQFYSVVIGSILFVLLLAGCSGKQEVVITSSDDIAGVISSYTSGTVGSESEIAVRFIEPISDVIWQQNAPLFTFQPSIPGKQSWIDNRTVVFKPDQKLKNGSAYTVGFDLARVKPELGISGMFQFEFDVIVQDFDVRIDPLSPDPATPGGIGQILTGHIITADVVTLEDIRKVIQVRVKGEPQQLSWTRDSRSSYTFTVKGIQREAQPGQVTVSWNGEAIGSTTRGQRQVQVPSTGTFAVTDINVTPGATPSVEITFSDLLEESQNLRGLITLEGQPEPGFIIRNNTILVHPRVSTPGDVTLNISASIRNRDGKSLEADLSRVVTIGNHKPEVRLLGSGVILSRNAELLFPFEAVNLGAVDVQVTRIFENNIAQFLQNNTLSGSYSMREVGRPVVQKVVPLQTLGETGNARWNSYALDLSKIMTPEPGAIYTITIGFRQHQSLYPCEAGQSTAALSQTWVQEADIEKVYWDGFEYYWVQGDYNWRDRDNPCTNTYYNSSRRVRRNAFASELGLIAKRSTTGDVQIIVSDLTTARPLNGIQLEILDYQQQRLAQGSSNSEGKWNARNLPRDPYLLIASRGTERGYLRLDDATSLNMSDFDVSGMRVEDGIKGFMYAERNVWRPGDSLFVSLIIEATEADFPKNHPVTFELLDPAGRVMNRRVVQGVGRMFAFPTRTTSDAPTGRWMVRARAGGVTFSHGINIETIQPNRLRVDLKLQNELLTGERAILRGDIQSEWLHGAIAGGLETDVNVTLRSGTLSFSRYPRHTFSDPLISLESTSAEIFKGKLDADGKTSFSHTFERPTNAPGLIIGTLNTRVFEESGNFSTNRSQFRHVTFNRLVGIQIPTMDSDWAMLDRDRTHTAEIVVLDPEGNPVANRQVTITVSELDWRWWWQRRNENLSQYYSSRNLRSIFTETVTTDARGLASVQLPTDRLDWGRYLARVTEDNNGHSSGVVFYMGWGSGREEMAGSPQRLNLDLDKQSYQTGEHIALRFPGSAQGRALISLENGTRVVQSFWVDTRAGNNEVRIQTTAEMSPNVYATVHVIQPNAQRDNDLPIRMYGVVPISIENPATRLNPVIELPSELRPETRAQVRIKEANGRKMTYSIAIVDEGLLDITNFKTPQPHDHFYAREALGVRTWDMYNEVAGTYAGSLNRILAIGGDLEINPDSDDGEVNRFKPMVRVLGPFVLEAGRTATHSIQVPNYVGSVRTMVIAAQDGAYGNSETRTPVRQPVMVLGTLPRVLSPGETVTLPVSVFAMRDDIRRVDVELKTNTMFSIAGTTSSRQVADFDRAGSQTRRFELEVANRTGAGSVRIDARSGSETAYDQIDIAVRNPSIPVTTFYEKALAAGESWSLDYDPIGIQGSNSGVLEVSGIPTIDLGRRLKWLNLYPHSNLEYRISATFPYLYLNRFTTLDDNQKADATQRIQFLISSMEQFKTPSGGLAFWPGSRSANEWVTSYAFHFLLEAEKAGYFIPAALMQSVSQFQRQVAASWRQPTNVHRRNDIGQAYRLYTLALSGSPAMGPMNRLRESESLSLIARWRLAAAYYVAGNPEAADGLTREASAQLDVYRDMWDCFCSTERDRAMILEALSIMNRPEMAIRLMQTLSASLSSDNWMSTQSVAFSLIAAARFIEMSPVTDQINVSYTVSSLGEGSILGVQPLSIMPFEIEGTATQSARIVNRGNGMVFVRVSQTGTPMMENLRPTSNGLSLNVRYFYPNGEVVDPARLRQGTDIIAEVTVGNIGNRGIYRQIALNHIFPSGWQISNARLEDITFGAPTGIEEHQDIRDDRVITYFDLNAGQSRKFQFRFTATWQGRFYLPAISAYALYDNSINATIPGKWVEVVRE